MEEGILKTFIYLTGTGIVALVATTIHMSIGFAVLRNDVKHILISFDDFCDRVEKYEKRLTAIEKELNHISDNTDGTIDHGKK